MIVRSLAEIDVESRKRKLTLLAPARDIEVGKAAIDVGADAVYIGAPQFGARQAAGNSVEDIAELVKYAHVFGAQVLVTLNTLLRDDEYAPACALAHQLYKVGVDALIIQDLHLLECDLPPIRLHASTQCDNRTIEQVLALQAMGFRRVVLARELSINKIRTIHEAVVRSETEEPIELEAFVHGALCVSYSGRCYMSEVLMDRSANRGCCAQMCRMRYDLLDKDGNEIRDDHGVPIHQRYLLSLQDMDRSQSLREMIEAGVTTFKIEGRLKDRDYVTNVVAYYRQLIDKIEDTEALAHGKTEVGFVPNPSKTFHRGQTDYFLHGRTRPMANWQTPKSTGEPIGTVAYIQRNAIGVELLPDVVLHNGDGLCFGDQGFAVNGVSMPQNAKGFKRLAIIVPNQMPRLAHDTASPTLCLAVGTQLYRNQDVVFLRSLHAERHIPVVITFGDTPDGYRLTMLSDDRTETLATMDIAAEHQAAQNPARAYATIREQISKLGDTPYIAKEVIIQHDGTDCQGTYPYFLPISLLNDYRRQLVQAAIHNALTMRDASSPQQSITKSAAYCLQREDSGTQPLMTCKYCILHELGHCRKEKPMQNEPRYLQLQNGTRVTLTFDCANCQMLITKP